MKWAVFVVLGISLVSSLALNLYFYWSLAESRDRRPTGDTFALKRDVPVYINGDSNVAFMLPQGTRLQDSTPKGAATLGKFYGHEFILVLRQGDETAGRQIDADLFNFSHANPYNSFSNDYSLRATTSK
jgi:hypothetical protein